MIRRLSTNYKALLASFDKKKPVFFRYYAECDTDEEVERHREDVRWATGGIKDATVSEWWDGKTIEFIYTVPFRFARRVIDKGIWCNSPYQ